MAVGAAAAATETTGSGAVSPGSSFGSAALSSGLDTGGNLAANLITGMINNYYQKQAFERNKALANTAHQREVADLRAAGLNPILSATGGRGADTPSSGAATMPASDVKPASSFWSAKSAMAQISNLQKTGNLIDEQARREHSAASMNDAITTKTGFDQLKTIAETNVSSAQQKVLMQELLIKTYEAQKARIVKGIYDIIPEAPLKGAKKFLENPGKAIRSFLQGGPVPIQMPDTTGRR